MNQSKFPIILAAALLLMASCNNVDFRKTSAGVPYKVFSTGKGDTIGNDYFVKYEVIHTLKDKNKDSVLFSSYIAKRGQYVQIQPLTGPVNYMDISTNILEMLRGRKKGDSLYITQSVDSLIRQNPEAATQGPFRKGQEIVTTVRIAEMWKTREEALAFFNKEAAASAEENEKKAMEDFKKDTAAQNQLKIDNKQIEDYLTTKNIPTQKTEMGVYIQVQNPGTGPKPSFGKWVTVKYRGTHFDGSVFDEGTYPYQIGGQNRPIPGFDNGVKQLGKGGSAKIIVPSTLGYGPGGSGPKIQPNENLVFDIEIVDISDDQPRPQMPALPDSSAQRR